MKTFKTIAMSSLFILAAVASLPTYADNNSRGGDRGDCSNLCNCLVTQNWGNGAYYNWAVYKKGALVATGNDAVLGEQGARKVCRDWTITQKTCYE